MQKKKTKPNERSFNSLDRLTRYSVSSFIDCVRRTNIFVAYKYFCARKLRKKLKFVGLGGYRTAPKICEYAYMGGMKWREVEETKNARRTLPKLICERALLNFKRLFFLSSSLCSSSFDFKLIFLSFCLFLLLFFFLSRSYLGTSSKSNNGGMLSAISCEIC